MRLLPLIFALFVAAAADAQQGFTAFQFSKLAWLEGSWKGMARKAAFYEAWRWVNDSTMLNLSIEINNGDTTIAESTTLRLHNGILQLGNSPALWTGSRLVANEVVLRNDTARFSNTIIWMNSTDDHWITILEHPKSSVLYDMTRDAVLDRKVDAWIRQRGGR